MEAAECIIGSAVVVAAADEFYQFIDGWRGKIADYQSGYCWIDCINPDGQAVSFLVPPDQLRKDKP